jgi:hypothetical protein
MKEEIKGEEGGDKGGERHWAHLEPFSSESIDSLEFPNRSLQACYSIIQRYEELCVFLQS